MMTKPKVVILSSFPDWLVDETIPQFKGHYAIWLTALSEKFQEQSELEIHWIILSKRVKKNHHVVLGGQEFHILPRARKMIGLYTYYWHDCRLINKKIKQIKPDIVHAWGIEDCYGFAVRNYKGKKILSIQGLLTACMRQGAVAPFERKQSFYEKITLNSFDFMTAESPWAIEQAKIINPEAKYQRFEYAVETRFFSQERNLSDQPFCLYGGSATPTKNIPLLIEAFSQPELSSIQLILAGVDSHQFPNLPSNIQAIGRVPRERMVQLLSETWCVVHPSLADCAPNIANEARVMGVPVIITTHCGGQQHITHGKNGYIFEPNDKDSLIKHVLNVCSSKENSIKMGAFDQSATREKLSKEFMYKRIIELYKQLLER